METDWELRKAFDRLINETGMVQVRMPASRAVSFARKLGLFETQRVGVNGFSEPLEFMRGFIYRGVRVFSEPIEPNSESELPPPPEKKE